MVGSSYGGTFNKGVSVNLTQQLPPESILKFVSTALKEVTGPFKHKSAVYVAEPDEWDRIRMCILFLPKLSNAYLE